MSAEWSSDAMLTTTHRMRMATHGFFVTGTDTGVGKTLVSCALLHAFAASGQRAVGMKPVAAGAQFDNGVWRNDDVEQLIAASNVQAPREAVNPYCFEQPIAPHIAASLNNNAIKIRQIRHDYLVLAALAEVVIVEGAGGFLVPLNDHETSADLAQQLGLPVLLVVGMRLGCLNHALLTAEVIRARGLTLAGWIANHIDAQMPHADENVATLSTKLDAPLLGRIAFTQDLNAAAIAAQLNVSALL
jgi:dethiobiotin synthetase